MEKSIVFIDFFKYISENHLSLEFDELLTVDGLLNYYNIRDLSLKTNATIDAFPIPSLEIVRVLQLSGDILNLVFHHHNPVIDKKEIYKIITDICLIGGNNPFTGYVQKKDGKRSILIECVDKVACIPTITHEASHIIMPISYTPNYHHTEMIPILVEFIASYILDRMDIGENNLELAYAYWVANLKHQIILKNKYDENQPEKIDFNEEGLSYAFNTNYTYTYIISTLYAFNLLPMFFDNYKSFLTKLSNSIISGENIQDLYKYYGLDFSSSKFMDEPTNILKKYL